MGACPDEETILGFCMGDLAACPVARRSVVEAHIATCDECRALVSAVARSSLVLERSAPVVPRPVEDRHRLEMSPTELVDSGRGPLSAPVVPGQILGGKFAVERVLGAGGMGVVVAARHLQLDQRVALKFLLPAACEVPGAVQRFLREGKAAARITSEHVARVTDTGLLEGGAPYLVMEYLEGQDLGAACASGGPLAVADIVEYVLQACEAIVEAHELGIVHRDLKPANLFLSKRADGTPLVKVLDFGISKVDGGSRSQLTSASVLMGSPRYMSPEQMLSARDVDARTDIWSLGVILFELSTGRVPWTADTVQGLCAQIATEPAPAPSSLRRDLPAAFDEVVLACLSKDRAARIGSVAELARALEPLAPDAARTSIARIVRVGSTSVRPPATVTPAPASVARAITAADPAPDAGSSKVVPLLVGVVAALLLVGVGVNAALSRARTTEPDSPHAAAPLTQAAVILPSAAPAPSFVPAPSPSIERTESPAPAPVVPPRRPAAATPVAVPRPVTTVASASSAVAVHPPAPPEGVRVEVVAPAVAPSSRAYTDRK